MSSTPTVKDLSLRIQEMRTKARSEAAWRPVWNVLTLGGTRLWPEDDDARLRAITVPDGLLADIAALPSISAPGARFLSIAIAKGWLSIYEADHFLELERGEDDHVPRSGRSGLDALKTRIDLSQAA